LVSRLVSDRGVGSRGSSAWLLVLAVRPSLGGVHRGSGGDGGGAVELVAVVGDEVDQYPIDSASPRAMVASEVLSFRRVLRGA
jgi:hypothetical protein